MEGKPGYGVALTHISSSACKILSGARSHRFVTRNGLGHRTVASREESFEDFTLAVAGRDTTK
jgi:hypothetical protein